VTKSRRPVSTGEMLTFCEHTMRTVCAELNVELVEFNGETDHVHLLVADTPTLAISSLVQRLQRPHRRHHRSRTRRLWNGVLGPPIKGMS
jgi:REP element-mobilizing transposase RayT